MAKCQDCRNHKPGTQEYQWCRGVNPPDADHKCPAHTPKGK